ncbi:tagaturonate reductase [Parageobacillus thermoglucosidasius]|uniref:tagaturonate reductase n=1 Tax=Parageobacillus thermoglucosidasius TaxID=1426 RepID=UPI000E12242E|nr:tagaturonate reductase [Parageobacillus thermoglucosidasius]RDE27418.1 tagaturonate reductase [Parageobacillus thermoglucosidasius]
MQKLNKKIFDRKNSDYQEKVLQFGSGNFLRAFVDWQIEKLNQVTDFCGSVVIAQSTDRGIVDQLNAQDGLFTVYVQGKQNNQIIKEHTVITCVSRGINIFRDYQEYLKIAKSPYLRFIISNTTEAGIRFEKEDLVKNQPPKTFPGKLTILLHERFKAFKGDKEKGLIIIPCELIDRNGEVLKKIVIQYAKHWDFETEFIEWVELANKFCCSLVDRIVPGYPHDTIDAIAKELGYIDELLVIAEPYYSWIIEGPSELKEEFPFEKANLNVQLVKDITPYQIRKVRILNGAHTAMMPVAYLYGCNTVCEAVKDTLIRKYVEELIYKEIIPTVDLPEKETQAFASTVLERFENPFIQHYLTSIALNSMSKFKTRNMPTLLEYFNKYGKLPERLVFSLSALIFYYKGKRGNETIELVDDEDILQLYKTLWSKYTGSENDLHYIVESVLGYEKLWKIDLNEIPGLTELTTTFLTKIEQEGIKKAMELIL